MWSSSSPFVNSFWGSMVDKQPFGLIFHYTPADLHMLQNGRLSPLARQRLASEYQVEWLFIGGAALFVGIFGLPIVLSNVPIGLLITLLAGWIFVGPWVRYVRQFQRDLAAGLVEQVSGRFHLHGPLTRRTYFRSHFFYDLQGQHYLVKAHEFQLIRQVERVGVARPHPGGDYTLFYLPQSRRVVAVLARAE
jgi:hypothetical protein